MSRYTADYQLCLRVRDGDEWAFEELLRRHRDVLHFQTAGLYAPERMPRICGRPPSSPCTVLPRLPSRPW